MLKLCALFLFACVVSTYSASLRDSDSVSSIDYSSVSVQEKDLYVPELDEIVEVLSSGLPNNFETVEVSVVDSPDFTEPPYYLTSPGLNGDAKLVEIGGASYFLPSIHRDKVYDMKQLLQYLDRDPAFLVGAGAGPWPYLGGTCEGIINLSVKDGSVTQDSRVACVVSDGESDGYVQQQLPNNETRTTLVGSYLLSEGKPGKVIKVVAKKRTGSASYIEAITETLQEYYGDKVVGLGGMFILLEGSTSFHVMPQSSSTPMCNYADIMEWVHYYEMKAPLNIVGTLVTGDMGLDLTTEHFHGFSDHGDAGHYHYDTTPDSAHYEGYFVPASSIIRIDPPTETVPSECTV